MDIDQLYLTRTGFHAINVQFLNLVLRWPGSTHIADILMNGHIADIFETGQTQTGCLLVNSAYPLKPWLLSPVSDPKTHLSAATM